MTLGGSNSDSVAQDQIRAFVERILRMREEAKAINDDIREIYAEAKGNGFDKTVLGKLVLYVEKRQKNADALAERDALFDLYLEAFDGSPSRAHAHTREDEYEPEAPEPRKIDGPNLGAAEPVDSLSASHAADLGGEESGMLDSLSAEPGSSLAAVVVPSAVGNGLTSPAGAEGDEDRQPIHIPTAADNARSIRPWCLHADDLSKCAGMGRKHCFACQTAHADEVGDSA